MFFHERWINPDEGKHLYDAKFVLDGKIPIVDYGSRMPVYVYILAAFLKLFGVSYEYGRIVPMFSTLGIGLFIFLIGYKLFSNKQVALLGSAIYLFSPLSLMWSSIVKTEPVAILFVCVGMYFMLCFLKEDNSSNYYLFLLFLSGIFFALAYYVRKSTLIIIILLPLFFIAVYKINIQKIIKNYSIVLLGYFSVVLCIFAYFGFYMDFSHIWNSVLNPLNSVIRPISQPNISQPNMVIKSIYAWIVTFALNTFLFFGLILSLFLLLIYSKKRQFKENIPFIYSFLYFWIFSLFIFYIYYTFQTVFYTTYFRELLPPLVLITSFVTIFFVSKIKSQDKYKKNISLMVLLILFALYISPFFMLPTLESYKMQHRWSPQTVKDVAQYINMHSTKEDSIMSGAVIWSLESNRKPFSNITHTGGIQGTSEDKIKKIEIEMIQKPPKFIILDGETEQTFLKIKTIQNTMNESYTLTKVVNGSYHPIQIYELKEELKKVE